MKHIIIGTAGHVDHGKTALVKALTGIDTDRLKEEKERGISIELGFAHLVLPGGLRAGIVDVPGHERFIKNMLAGAAGFDLVLLVVAADEGVMPQTREHLDIIQLLQVKKGIVVITKCDLVDKEWLEMVSEEVESFLEGTVLEGAPVIRVSAVTGQGIPELLEAIGQVAQTVEEKAASGPPRLPIDRVFTVTGFGTVVTGTLVSGTLRLGDQLEVLPQGISTRVRSLQVHGQKVEEARAGQRVAINLAGVEVEQIERGSVVSGPKSLVPSYRVDAKLVLLKSAPRPLKNRSRVRFYLGTREVLGRVVLLDREEMEPGSTSYVQLELEDKAVAARGDRFVIRSYSPMLTIGGGVVIDPAPRRRRRRFRPEVLAALATLEKGSPADLLEEYLKSNPWLPSAGEAAAAAGLGTADLTCAINTLVSRGKIRKMEADGKTYLIPNWAYRQWTEEIISALSAFHRDYPLREGMPKEELRTKKYQKLNSRMWQCLLGEIEKDGLIKSSAQCVMLQSFTPKPNKEEGEKIDRLLALLRNSRFQPPSWAELCRQAGLREDESAEVLQYLLKNGELVKITDDIFLTSDVLQKAKETVLDYLRAKGEITVGELRDLLNTSRKYALPIMEYFDQIKFTKRVGDKRLLGRAAE